MDEQETVEQLRIMSEENTKKSGLDLKPTQIAAGALAAVTAALLGSTLNVAGTIIGAAIASVVSTIGSALYQKSIERTRESVLRVGSKAWVVKPVEGETASEADAPDDKTEVDAEDKTREARRWPKVAAGAVLVFVLGMLAVTGVEWLRGAPLSGGDQGTTLGAVVGKPTERAPEQQAPQPSVSSTPDAPTTTTAPPATSSGTQTTTTEPSPSSTTQAPSSAPPVPTTGQPTSEAPAQTAPVAPTGLGTTG
ncbi:MAG: hypothetical protein ABIQ18_29320 [Umezawaea sp.]